MKCLAQRGVPALLLLLLTFGAANAQEFRGAITGTVTDPNGAIVPAATVTVQNVETNIAADAQTNDEGNFTFPLLMPGRYKLTVAAANFKTSVRENIQINVGDRLTIDMTLEIGAAAEVNIVAAEEVVERGSVTTGTVITERQITELPLPEGAAYNLATQTPGVSFTGNPAFSGPTANGNLAGFRTNGASGNQITLDGSPNATFDGGVAYTPPADAVSQFKIQTSAFDAQNGFTAGSTVNVAVKSGTNKLHGSGYYFNRLKAFTANNFFNNRVGAERPDRLYYRYGGQINGPVYIPKIYNGKDRTFFMFSYEKQYNKRAEPEIFSVPTAAMRNGNFSELLSYKDPITGNVTPIIIYDPATARCANTAGATVQPVNGACPTGSNVTRDPFPGNIIPANRINAAAQKFLNLYPAPNQSGVLSNFFSNNISIQPYNSYLTRIDHNFNENHRIFGKFFYSKSAEDRYNFIGTPEAFTRGNEIRENIGGSADYTATLSSNLVFDLRSSLNYFVQDRFPLNPISAADLGFTGLDAVSDSTMLPRFTFTNYTTLGPERSDFNEGLTRDFKLFSLQPTLTQIYGNHTLKYGYDYRRLMERRTTNGFNAGSFSFTGTFTNRASNLNSGAEAINLPGREIAAFLLGIPAASPTGSFIEQAASYDFNTDYHGFFVQDDWRVSPKLTLNLGLRYELETGLREAQGRVLTGFDPTAASPLRAAALANYNASVPAGVPITAFQNLSGGLTFASGSGDANQKTDKNNWQPRIGVSYGLDDKTVLRGGFGIFASPFQIQTATSGSPQYQLQTGFTANTPFSPTSNNGLTFIANLNNPFPSGINQALGSSQGLLTSVGNTLGVVSGTTGPTSAILSNERKNPSYARFIAGIQRELPGGIAAEATFVMSRGYNLPVLRQLNYLPRELLNNFGNTTDAATILNGIFTTNTFLTQTVPNPFRTLVGATNPFNAANLQRRLLLSPFPQFQDLVVTEYNGSNDYRSLQLQVNKRLNRGVSLNASYTYAHEREKTRRLNPQDEELLETLSVFSRPHRFTLSGVFELPFGKNRSFFNNWHPVAEAVLGGWQLNAVYEWQSGEPLVFGNVFYNGDPSQLKARIGQSDEQGRKYGVDIPAFDVSGFRVVDPRPTLPTGAVNPNFNQLVVPGFGNNFSVTGQNTLRNFPYTLNNLRNQPFQKFDLGLTKNFHIREGMKFQLRVEAINALNWVYYSGLQLGVTNSAFGLVNTQRNLPRDFQLGGRFTF